MVQSEEMMHSMLDFLHHRRCIKNYSYTYFLAIVRAIMCSGISYVHIFYPARDELILHSDYQPLHVTVWVMYWPDSPLCETHPPCTRFKIYMPMD